MAHVSDRSTPVDTHVTVVDGPEPVCLTFGTRQLDLTVEEARRVGEQLLVQAGAAADPSFVLQFATGNAAFAEAGVGEVARILRYIAAELELGNHNGAGVTRVRDVNGNRVGFYTVVLPQPEVDDEDEGGELYEVVKFVRDGDNEVLETDLSLEEAKERVNAPGTSGEGWFLGYRAL